MEKIKVLCYGTISEYNTRKEAIDLYREGACCSEGSEKERYMNILLDLLDGKNYCTDGVEW